jgi:hypothetical protein
MQKLEIDSTVVACVAPANDAPNARYDTVRFNAMKHGVLSKLAVLAHEDHAEFADLLDAMIDEHRPAGITERLLIEELATIIWRKRRVLLAEGAKINQGLQGAISRKKSVVSAAAPFQRGLSGEDTDLCDVMESTPKQLAENQQYAKLDLAGADKAAAILRKGGTNAYVKARRALIPDTRDWWDSLVEGEERTATAEDLTQFVRETLSPYCYDRAREAQYSPAIKAQTLGEGLQAHQLEKLNRYETHLDRKFERTLAMILKLKDLRGG